jgi:small subunit ribosomal protein S1
MENFETNDSTKDLNRIDLSDDETREESDVEAAQEKASISADTADEGAVSDDSHDTTDTSSDVQEAGLSSEESPEIGGDSDEVEPPSESSKDVQSPDESMDTLMSMYEESFKRFAEGEVVTGKIISIDKDYVLVDIGYKSEGQIRIQEFNDENGQLAANVGDKVDVMV